MNFEVRQDQPVFLRLPQFVPLYCYTSPLIIQTRVVYHILCFLLRAPSLQLKRLMVSFPGPSSCSILHGALRLQNYYVPHAVLPLLLYQSVSLAGDFRERPTSCSELYLTDPSPKAFHICNRLLYPSQTSFILSLSVSPALRGGRITETPRHGCCYASPHTDRSPCGIWRRQRGSF